MSTSTDLQLPSFVDSISSLAFHPTNPNLLLVASWDRHIYLHDLRQPNEPRKLAIRGAVLDVAWAGKGTEKVAYVGGLAKEVRSINFDSNETQLITKHDDAVRCVEFSEELNAVVSGSWDSTLRLTSIDPSTSQPSPTPLILKLPHKVYSLSVSRSKIVCAMGGRQVWIWDIPQLKREWLEEGKKGEEIEPWQKRESSLKFMTRAVKTMPNDTGYVTTSIEGRVAVEFFDPSDAAQKKKYAFKCHRQVIEGVDTVYPVQGLAFNPAHGTFATGGGDSTVSIWDPAAKKRLRQFPKYPSPISALEFNADGSLLAIAFSEGDEGAGSGAGGVGGGNGVKDSPLVSILSEILALLARPSSSSTPPLERSKLAETSSPLHGNGTGGSREGSAGVQTPPPHLLPSVNQHLPLNSMGVRDLTSVAKKLAPSCFTPAPSLRTFANSRFAIDAQLLSTKFFFVPRSGLRPGTPLVKTSPSASGCTPAEARQIGERLARAWYHFLTALRKEGIEPIVVFDGDTRVREKARENERRRKGREVQMLRGVAEGERGVRLREVKRTWEGVQDGRREAVKLAFQRALAEEKTSGVEQDDRREEGAVSSSPVDSTSSPASTPTSTPTPSIDALSTSLSPAETALLSSLLNLYRSFLADVPNPIYSKKQHLVTIEERAFFHYLLGRQGSFFRDSQEVVPGAYDEVTRQFEEREVRGDEEVVETEGREELEEVIEMSDKLGASHLSRAVFVPKSAFDDTLINHLGIPYLEPSPSFPHEAEGVCSVLYHLGLVDYVVSDDTDVAAYGAKQIRRISTVDREKSAYWAAKVTATEVKEGKERAKAKAKKRKGKGKKEKEGMAVMDPDEFTRQLELSREEFVDWCLLCGTDFTERIPFLGPANALKQIRQYSTIEAILEANAGRYVPVGGNVEAYLETVRDARALFLSKPVLPQVDPSPALTVSADSPPLPSLDALSSPITVDDPSTAPSPSPSLSPAFSGSLTPRPPHPSLRDLLKRLNLRPWRGLLPPASSSRPRQKSAAVVDAGRADEALPAELGDYEVERDEEGTRVEMLSDSSELPDEEEEIVARQERLEADLAQQRRAQEDFERMMA